MHKNTFLTSKRYLIGQIRTIYSIQQSSDGKSLSINGFRLPNSDFTGCDEEQIATALGYVAHILHLAAKYLEVPLRYPMIPMCSRSMILDEISQQTSPKYDFLLLCCLCLHYSKVSAVFSWCR